MEMITLIKNNKSIIPIGTMNRCVAGSIKNGTNIIAATTNQIKDAAKRVAVIVPGVAILFIFREHINDQASQKYE